jgi:hypothetical protein
MYCHPLSSSSPLGITTAEPATAEKRTVAPTDQTASAAEFQPSTDTQILLARLRNITEIRSDIVAEATARVRNGDFFSPAEAQATAQAILGQPNGG